MKDPSAAPRSRSFTASSGSPRPLTSQRSDLSLLSDSSFSRYFHQPARTLSIATSQAEESLQWSRQSSFHGSEYGGQSRKRKFEDGSSQEDSQFKRLSLPDFPLTEPCSDCKQFDLRVAVDVDPERLLKSEDGISIANVGKRFRTALETDDCSLCRILFTSRLEAKHSEGEDDELRAFPFVRYFSDIKDDNRSWRAYLDHNKLVFLAVVPSHFSFSGYAHGFEYHNQFGDNGYALCYDEPQESTGIFAAQLVARDFQPEVALRWLNFCKRRHRKLCGQTPSWDSDLQLIDCETRGIIPAHNSTPYVALSYVWGSAYLKTDPNEVFEKGKLPSVVSKVVEDAITVTKSLRLRFLWIDKFCIDQDNAAVKHEQIKQMDSIYANAEITLVAAAGDDESCGLPGVGGTPRSSQATASVGGVRVISTLAHPHRLITSSKWSTRGWTYQEGVLSRRRLVFTDEQVYFECNAMNCYESIASPLNLLHTKDRSRFRGCMRAGIFGRKNSHIYGHFDVENLAKDGTFIRYLNHVETYTERALRFDSDSLNAFAGIMRHFETMKWPVLHLWGVPFLHPETGENMDSKEYDRYLTDALCWNHRNSCWDEDHSPRRRSEIPSWSWAGWAGAVEYQHREYHEAITFVCEIQNICLEFGASKASVDYRTAFSTGTKSDRGNHYPRALSFDARAIPATAYSLLASHGTTRMKVFDWFPDFTFSSGPKTTREALEWFKKEKLLSLFMGWQGSRNHFMIVQSNWGVYFRVGLMTVETNVLIESTPKRRFLIE